MNLTVIRSQPNSTREEGLTTVITAPTEGERVLRKPALIQCGINRTLKVWRAAPTPAGVSGLSLLTLICSGGLQPC